MNENAQQSEGERESSRQKEQSYRSSGSDSCSRFLDAGDDLVVLVEEVTFLRVIALHVR